MAGPKGLPQIGQCRVAVLVKGMPESGPASGAQPKSEASALAAASAVGLPCGLRLALADLGRSESYGISLKEY